MMFSNRSNLLGDDLRKEIKPGSKVKIVASGFSIYAFEALKKEFAEIEELEFIFFEPTFTSKPKNTKAKEFFISKLARDKSLYGTEFEIKLRNQLIQKSIIGECIAWIRNKVRFKSIKDIKIAQGYIYIDSGSKKILYTPIIAFTTGDLGFQKSNYSFQAICKVDSEEITNNFLTQFNSFWNDNEKCEDVTEVVIENMTTVYKENSPQFIYFLTLYNIFKDFLQDTSFEDNFPDELTGYQNSIVWQKLFSFQKDGAIGVINKLEKYNGCILADSVGLGKTFTALAVMKYYASRNKNILVLTPKKLGDNWNRYKNNTKTNIFFKDHIRFDVLYITDLTRSKGFSNGIDLANFNWDNYDLVVIDESHNFRNDRGNRGNNGRMTRYQFLANKVLKSGVRSKVLMISATPVNNRFTDLKNQIQLAYGDDPEGFNNRLDTTKSVNEILRRAQGVYNDWIKLPKQSRNAKKLMSLLDFDFLVLLDNITIARSRKHITKYYNISEIGNFPQRLTPKSFYVDIVKADDTISYKTIYDKLMKLTMGVYAPTVYIQPSKYDKYAKKYDTEIAGKTTLSQLDRDKSLQKLITINILKRLESSVDSFKKTIENVKRKSEETLKVINEFESNKGNYNQDFDNYTFDFDDEELTTIGKIQIDLKDMDLRKFKNDVKYDYDALNEIYDIVSGITPEKDLKLQKIIEIVCDKIEHPINGNNRKILIFSAFADTVKYLYDNIMPIVKEKYGMESAMITGSDIGNLTTISGSKDTDRILTMFAPIAKERDLIFRDEEKYDIDLLIATDCLSEGQNLQDCDICINYDIHWNPVRIVQRFGRIDRIGSKNKQIQLVNFWPNIKLDEYIKLTARVENRMVMVDATATGDDNILSEDDSDALDYRKAQLKKLQEGTLQDLEDVEGQITITDLGLNEFRMDLLQYIKVHQDLANIPNGLYAVVKANPEKNIEKGVIYVLRNRNENINIVKKNRLHPYYLVYLQEDGSVAVNHTDAKQILDILRTTCKYQPEPNKQLCNIMNKETKNGYKMDKYSKLLDNAVKAIVKQEDQNTLESLFAGNSDVLFDKQIAGLDDFELITFAVIK